MSEETKLTEQEFHKKYAEQKNLNMETVVNDWLREDISQLMDNPQLT